MRRCWWPTLSGGPPSLASRLFGPAGAFDLGKVAELKNGLLHRLVDLHSVLGGLSVPLQFPLAEEDLAAEQTLAPRLQLLYHLHHRFLRLRDGTALSAVHADEEYKQQRLEVSRISQSIPGKS